MWEDRTGTMIYDELPFHAEATRSPHASRRWSLVVDAAVGPLSVTARLGVPPPQHAESDHRLNPGMRPSSSADGTAI